MKGTMFSLLFLAGMFAISDFGFGADAQNLTPQQMAEKIDWIGQSAVRINIDDKIIYIDPYQIKHADKADIILITHSHADHFSVDDILKIAGENTIFIAARDCVPEIEKISKSKIVVLEPGMKTNLENILVEAVAAYNIVKTNYHPPKNKWAGYILTIDGIRIYHAGDTERIPEMKEFVCDIAMLPLGQTFTMNSVSEAAEAALDVQAKIALPIHYGLYEGTMEDAEVFKKLLKDKIQVIIKNYDEKGRQ